MTIEIRKPHWMRGGAIQNVEDVLIQAYAGATGATSALTGADLVAAMQSSPSKQIDLDARMRLRKTLKSGLVQVGDRNWTRDDLHDR